MNHNGFDLYGVTIDVDWSPDFWIDQAAEMLSSRGIKSTWFLTHDSPAIRRLMDNPLVECGIHPNFFQPSSHGATEDEVVDFMRRLVPDARSVRAHALMQSSRLFAKYMGQDGYFTECSSYAPNAAPLMPYHIVFSKNLRPLVRIPYFWEDDVECQAAETGWDPGAPAFHPPGLKIFNFHPVYIGLNCHDFSEYIHLKKSIEGKKGLNECSPEDVAPFIRVGQGVKSCFHDLLEILTNRKDQVMTQEEISKMYRQQAGIDQRFV